MIHGHGRLHNCSLYFYVTDCNAAEFTSAVAEFAVCNPTSTIGRSWQCIGTWGGYAQSRYVWDAEQSCWWWNWSWGSIPTSNATWRRSGWTTKLAIITTFACHARSAIVATAAAAAVDGCWFATSDGAIGNGPGRIDDAAATPLNAAATATDATCGRKSWSRSGRADGITIRCVAAGATTTSRAATTPAAATIATPAAPAPAPATNGVGRVTDWAWDRVSDDALERRRLCGDALHGHGERSSWYDTWHRTEHPFTIGERVADDASRSWTSVVVGTRWGSGHGWHRPAGGVPAGVAGAAATATGARDARYGGSESESKPGIVWRTYTTARVDVGVCIVSELAAAAAASTATATATATCSAAAASDADADADGRWAERAVRDVFAVWVIYGFAIAQW